MKKALAVVFTLIAGMGLAHANDSLITPPDVTMAASDAGKPAVPTGENAHEVFGGLYTGMSGGTTDPFYRRAQFYVDKDGYMWCFNAQSMDPMELLVYQHSDGKLWVQAPTPNQNMFNQYWCGPIANDMASAPVSYHLNVNDLYNGWFGHNGKSGVFAGPRPSGAPANVSTTYSIIVSDDGVGYTAKTAAANDNPYRSSAWENSDNPPALPWKGTIETVPGQ